MTAFPTSKIELHQWANTILMGIVVFIASQTYLLIQQDHEKIANHETRITVLEHDGQRQRQTSNARSYGIMPDEVRYKKEHE